jgi:hypothetical protein
MATKTRLKIKQEALLRSGDALGGFAEGRAAVMLDDLINDVTNDLCRATGAYYYGGDKGFTASIIKNQIEYCAPPLYSIVAVVATDSSGNRYPLTIKTERELDQRAGAFWRTAAPGSQAAWTGIPYWCYLQGGNTAGLFPVPDYTTVVYTYSDLVIGSDMTQVSSAARPFSAGDMQRIMIVAASTGFNAGKYRIVAVTAGVATLDRPVGIAASASGVAVLDTGGVTFIGYGIPPDWPNDTDPCPLQSQNHEAVSYGVTVRYLEIKASSPNATDRQIAESLLPMHEGHYREHRGMLEAEIATQAQHAEPGLYMYW